MLRQSIAHMTMINFELRPASSVTIGVATLPGMSVMANATYKIYN